MEIVGFYCYTFNDLNQAHNNKQRLFVKHFRESDILLFHISSIGTVYTGRIHHESTKIGRFLGIFQMDQQN